MEISKYVKFYYKNNKKYIRITQFLFFQKLYIDVDNIRREK